MLKKTVAVLGGAVVAVGVVVTATPALAAAPPAGTCWNLTYAQWRLDNLPAVTAVDCTTNHTAESLGTVTIPASMAGQSIAKLRSWAYPQCYGVARTYLGAAKNTALPATAQLGIFFPTAQEQIAGDRSVRCVGFNTTAKRKVTSRTGSVAKSGSKPHLCVNWNNWKFAKCGKKNTRALNYAVWISKSPGQKYPGNRKAVDAAGQKCKKLAKRKQEVTVWFVQGPVAWQYGNRFGYCSLK